MFDQTFVGDTRQTGKPFSLFASALLQGVVVALVVLAPLLVTYTLPNTSLKSTLMAPQPHVAPQPMAVTKSRVPLHTRSFQAATLTSPRVIPQQTGAMNDMQAEAGPDVSDVNSATSLPAPNDEDVVRQAPPPQAPPVTAPAKGPVRMGGQVAEANVIRRVEPLYPLLARTARVQGTVEFTAVISKEGRVEKLQLVRGHPLLVNAARETILQWRYRPTMLNGQPVEVVTSITVNFTLTQ